jgi:hypothetical protein
VGEFVPWGGGSTAIVCGGEGDGVGNDNNAGGSSKPCSSGGFGPLYTFHYRVVGVRVTATDDDNDNANDDAGGSSTP